MADGSIYAKAYTENISIESLIADDATSGDIMKMQKFLNARPYVKSLEYVSKDLPIIILCILGWLMVACLGQKTSPWTVAILAFFTLYLFIHCLYITSMKYHIGREQLMYERGLFTIKRDYIEMYRIVDYEESRNFLQMIFGLKTVTIHACDRTTPNLKIIGIPKNLDVIPTIRERYTCHSRTL